MSSVTPRLVARLSRLQLLVLALVISGCAAYSGFQLQQRYGAPEPRERRVSAVPAGAIDYRHQVKPIIESRCVVCHACYDAPCQLKMTAIEGIERGATSEKVYSLRLQAAEPSRLFEDAHSTTAWRDRGFHPVLNEHAQVPAAHREAGVMHQLLKLKARHPLPQTERLSDEFDLRLNRDQSCPKPQTIDQYVSDHPLWGMPYALPGLNEGEQNTLLRWLEQGATYTPRPPLPVIYRERVARWEQWLNGDSLKQQLVARYIYEHLFLAHLYFDDLDQRRFFKLVRSLTPPGQPIEVIATRRPYDDPKAARVYYRLQPERESIVAKTHMPYALNPQRREKWARWFLNADYRVEQLPSYGDRAGGNPFATFQAIPINSRYRFLLDEAKFTIQGFIKGPVCRGQAALNVINDRFWVFFYAPGQMREDLVARFFADQVDNLTIPAQESSNVFTPLSLWRKYSTKQQRYLIERDRYIARHLADTVPTDLNLIWDGGDAGNPNAALTVFRHFDSATVERGMLGTAPKTAWVMGYSVLERLHYLLVAGYDVYGNAGHQLVTRIYMDFLRMEGEANFLMLLPREARLRERDYWYREAHEEVQKYLSHPLITGPFESDIDYRSTTPKRELFDRLYQHIDGSLPGHHNLAALEDDGLRAELERLTQLRGAPVTPLPQMALLQVTDNAGSDRWFTLLRNDAHLNVATIFQEGKNRIPEEDELTVIPGIVGSYPNAFYTVPRAQVVDFVSAVAALRSEEGYRQLLDRFGLRRTDPDFWRHSDRVHAAYRQLYPIDSGWLDYNRLENR